MWMVGLPSVSHAHVLPRIQLNNADGISNDVSLACCDMHPLRDWRHRCAHAHFGTYMARRSSWVNAIRAVQIAPLPTNTLRLICHYWVHHGEHWKSHHMTRVLITLGDITTAGTDAIVNPANAQLAAGGGACGAIFRAAGHQQLADACAHFAGCPTGSAVSTPSFNLTTSGTQHIIHAVGPVWTAGDAERCDALLASAYRASLIEAVHCGATSIAFPAISTGIYGFPADRAATVVASLLAQETFAIDTIVLVFRDESQADGARTALHAVGVQTG